MAGRFFRSGWVLALAATLAGSAGLGACGSGGTSNESSKSGSSSSDHGAGGAGNAGGAGGGLGGSLTVGVGGASQALDVEPAGLETLVVAPGATTPTQTYKATVNGSPANVKWSVDQGALGTIPAGPSPDAVFAPTGTTGGLVNVLASFNGKTIQRPIFIKLGGGPAQNGPNPAEQTQVVPATPAGLAQLTAGGGVNGVGGEGLGPAVTDAPTLAALQAPVGNGQAQGLSFLYPYDKTVWPRGLLAPLLMWSFTPGDADAIRISLTTTSGSFSWTGTFGRPAILAMTGGKYIRSPIPEDVWEMATNTAGGTTPNNVPDQLVVGLTVAQGGMAYGPITETWNVAPARLSGTVYYNSYGTQLIKNSTDRDYNGNLYGAAILGIQAGATAPVVVAGGAATSPNDTSGKGCRVCHVVAMDGSRLIAVHGDDYQTTSSYDLKNGNAETVLSGYGGVFDWSGLYPDGSMALTNLANMGDSASPPASELFSLPPTTTTPIAVTGIGANLRAGTPAFSPDGTHVAFNFLGGTIGAATGNGTQLVVLDFDKATMAFTNQRTLATTTGTPGGAAPAAGFPSFFPTNDAVAFHYQLSAATQGEHAFDTWYQARAQVWWSDLKTGTATPLSALDGLNGTTSYLPTSPSHPDDTTVNYEPTVNPIVSGGYAWVIFTSRRLYGNLATGNPWLSNPRHYDTTDYNQVTCKKLWVAAVDIGSIENGTFMEGVPPGTDPSHPGFYLPAQELVAGNSRGFWVLDACKADGNTCTTGDQCCNGFCEPGADGLVCGASSGSCSGLQEKCTTSADCCDGDALCINGFCALGSPPAHK